MAVVIGMGLIWGAYTLGIWGYCLLNTYNVRFTDLFKADWPLRQTADPKLPTGP
jgi:hypothetical protein